MNETQCYYEWSTHVDYSVIILRHFVSSVSEFHQLFQYLMMRMTKEGLLLLWVLAFIATAMQSMTLLSTKMNFSSLSRSLWLYHAYRGELHNYAFVCSNGDRALKALLFNNVFTLKKSELHGPTCYQCLWQGVKMKPWKNCTSKASLSASKEWKLTSDQIYHTHVPP